MSRPQILWLVVAIGVLIVAFNTFYLVEQRRQAIVLSFGDPIRVISTPGLKMKAPFVENVVLLDKRNLKIEPEPGEIMDAKQERLVVDAFVRYRISDPLQFYRTLHDEQTAKDRLERLVNSSLRQILGTATSNEIIAGRREELMAATRTDVANRAKSSRLGIEIIDVRIKRVELPTPNRDAVFRQMTSNLQQQAAQTKAVGEQQKREIMAGADKEVTVTLATATEQAEAVRGQGDAQRTRIFADSYGKDPGFAAFYRSMQAYEAALGQGDTTMVLSPDSAFFRYFRDGPGK